MTDRKPLIEALKSAATTTLIDPKNWNIGLQAEASVRAVLAELDRQGWVCVPKVATGEMVNAYWENTKSTAESDWRAMLSAAPKLS